MAEVALISESGLRGPDLRVLSFAAGKIAPEIKVVPVPMNNKPNLQKNCRPAARKLIDDGCDHIFIIWDLYPSHSAQKPCRKCDVDMIRSSLANSGVDLDKVSLVCVEQELESWLIADRRALVAVLSTREHPVSPNLMRKQRNPDIVSNPKGMLRSIFKKSGSKRSDYDDQEHAILIAQSIPDCRYLSNSPSFRRFLRLFKKCAHSKKCA